MRKPEKVAVWAYEFEECRKYIEKKHKVDIRNFAGKTYDPDNGKPYQDFWHSLNNWHGTYGDTLVMHAEILEDEYHDMLDWERTIYQWFIDEFADEDGRIDFWV